MKNQCKYCAVLKEMIAILKEKSTLIFSVFVFCFFALFVFAEIASDKFWTNDLQVYYGAVHDFFRGNNPYEHAYGLTTGFFKYPPFTLYLFSPMLFLSFQSAQILHLFLSAVSLIVAVSLLKKVCEQYVKFVPNYMLYVGFFSIAVPIARELHMGNINLILLGLFSVGLFFFNRHIIIVFAWSLMIILKPIMILSILPLFFFDRWKIIYGCVLMGILFVAFPILQLGWNNTVDVWIRWIQSVADHGTYISSTNSLRYIANYYFDTNAEWLPSIVVLSVLSALLFYDKWKIQKISVVQWVIVFTAFIPNFFVTDTEHFLLSMPLILVLSVELIQRNKDKKRFVVWTFFIIALFLFSFNSRDLLGRHLDDFLSYRGAVGVGNMMFIALLIFVRSMKKSVFNH